MTAIDLDHLRQWEGRQETAGDTIEPAKVRAMAATLDWERAPEPGEELPRPWHWLYFLPAVRQSKIGRDGHPERGGFLPPVPLPRRMWASGSVEFLAPLRIGDQATRTSTVKSVTHKRGASGDLVFVTVEHAITAADRLAIRERQNLVYREDPDPGAPPPQPLAPPAAAQFGREWTPDPVLLFRYSALTFNGHRIHYDRDYAVQEEGYAGLVVHGPLSATLLLDLVRTHCPEQQVGYYDYRAVRPLTEGAPFRVEGCRADGGLSLWVVDHGGALTMQASVGAERPA
ncbi:MAG: FAS1-like dehydratase domain-containing protein [Pseudomonadota bacterium]